MKTATGGPAGWRQAGAALLLALAAATPAHALDLWKIDSYDEREDGGLLSRPNQKSIDALAIARRRLRWGGTERWAARPGRRGRALLSRR